MATNMYVKFEDPAIEGGSTAAEHAKDLEIVSWSHSFTQPTKATRSTAGGGTVEQANHSKLTFAKLLDSSTNALLKHCWSGKSIGKATLTCLRASGDEGNKPVEYLKVIMEHVLIHSYSISCGAGNLPMENIALDYGIIQYNYVNQKEADGTADGNKPAKHDLETRKIS